ncbi:hypothetical protein [Actinomycetospora sp.]|uniref:hypothetical protein n=1 Tax=Actinomycetospora sp. TaxID=1872135 RepID=UPI002F412EB9
MVVSLALRLAARRPHVLTIAPAPVTDDLLAVRLAAEAELARRRWPAADSPADADVVLVAGGLGRRMTAVVRAVWATVPAPRVLVTVGAAAELAEALDRAQERLARGGDPDVSDAAPLTPSVSDAAPLTLDVRNSTSSIGESPAPEPVMAGLADSDRDGLALDALHVVLGPVLPDWPAGLVVHAALAGDLVTDARAEVLDVPGPRDRPGGRHGPLGPDRTRLDALVRVLGLAGADRAAARARTLRDGDPAPGETAAFGQRLARSRTLAWTLRGIALAATDHVPVPESTVEARVRALAAGLGGSLAPPVRPAAHRAVAALVGLELGAARLALAAMDPDTALGAGPVEPFRPATAGHDHHHGHEHHG